MCLIKFLIIKFDLFNRPLHFKPLDRTGIQDDLKIATQKEPFIIGIIKKYTIIISRSYHVIVLSFTLSISYLLFFLQKHRKQLSVSTATIK